MLKGSVNLKAAVFKTNIMKKSEMVGGGLASAVSPKGLIHLLDPKLHE